jgi:benzoate-CoA ligase family protein
MGANKVDVDRGSTPAKLQFATPFNVAVAFIDRHLEEGRGAKTAIRCAAGDVSYALLAERVNRSGNALDACGLARGARMLMVVKDAPEFFYLFWGAIKRGLVPVPLNTLLRAADYRYMIEDAGATAVVYSPEVAEEVESALTASSPRPGIVLRTAGPDSFHEQMARASPTLVAEPSRAEDDCFWLYSSGSTGRPKAAVHLHRDMVVTSEHYGVGVLGIGEHDRCYSAAKLFFAYGLGNAMIFPLWVGATAVLNEARPTPQATFETIERFRPTLYFGVPTLYAAQLQAMEKLKPDLSSIRLCVSAGEALPGDILRRWREATGKTILDGIGSTEALHIFISNRPADVKPGSSGRLVPGYEARILDEAGREAGPGVDGQLFIRGASTAKYYWNNPERSARTMIDGWLNTGDTYRRDEEGYFFYCGRSDDMLKVGGLWCSPFEIEAKLIEHPKVLEVAVVGRADEDGLTKPEAFVVLKNPGDACAALAEELMGHCKSGLAHYKYPRWINFLPELPKTATGKIQRFKLRRACA